MSIPIEPIEQIIPHRAPFLFIDDVLELTSDFIICRKHISMKDSYLVYKDGANFYVSEAALIECLLQSGAYLMGMNSTTSDIQEGKQKYFVGSPRVKFGIIPNLGDVLNIWVEITKKIGQKARLQGEILCQSDLVLEGVFMVAEM